MTGTRTMALELAYRGAPFSGFARQPGLLTVQGDIENALSIALRTPVQVTGAGRTDAGVHALAQIVSFDVGPDVEVDAHTLMRSLNALTHEALSVRAILQAPPGFSARFDAIARSYRYRIVTGASAPQFLADIAWWHRGALDVVAMREAAGFLIGEHDFASFCSAESLAEVTTTNRCISSIGISETERLGEDCIEIDVVGNAFLHNMVRIIVGTLVEVGVGRREADWVESVREARDRSAAGPTAPGHGLTFREVDYPGGMLSRVAP